MKKVAENSRYPTTTSAGLEATPRRRRARRNSDGQHEGVAEPIAAPVRIPPGDEDTHDAEAAAKADKRTDLHCVESGTGNQHGRRRQEQAVASAIAKEAERAKQQHSRIGKCGEETVPDRIADQRSIASQFAADPFLFTVRQPWSGCWRVRQEAQQAQAQQDGGQTLHEEQPLPSPKASHAVKPQQAARNRAHEN